MAEKIRKSYGLDKAHDHRDSLGRFAASDAPAPAEAPAREEPKSRWSHHGAVLNALQSAVRSGPRSADQ